MNIKDLNNYYLGIWSDSGVEMPLSNCYTPDEKKRREEYLSSRLRKLSGLKTKQVRDENFQTKLFRSAEKAAGVVMNADAENLKIVFSDEFKKSSADFIDACKKFDDKLTRSDISQASRNLWVINCLQVLFGYPVKLTCSAFGYSLLYPYCDNYLDNPSISKSEKENFNSGLGLRLKGEKILPSNKYLQKIFTLISMIEEEYPRGKFPEVYRSLISIYKAQCSSMKLFKNTKLSINDILNLSFEKGGTSVLTDGFLVCGKLSKIQIRFLYGLGIYLQIIDDLQDLKEDRKAEVSTIFSSSVIKGYLDQLTNKTLNFGREIIKDTHNFSNGDSFRQLISESTNLLVIEAACLSQNAFSKNYIKNLEHFSPFHFSFIRKYRKRYSAARIPFQEILRAVPINT